MLWWLSAVSIMTKTRNYSSKIFYLSCFWVAISSRSLFRWGFLFPRIVWTSWEYCIVRSVSLPTHISFLSHLTRLTWRYYFLNTIFLNNLSLFLCSIVRCNLLIHFLRLLFLNEIWCMVILIVYKWLLLLIVITLLSKTIVQVIILPIIILNKAKVLPIFQLISIHKFIIRLCLNPKIIIKYIVTHLNIDIISGCHSCRIINVFLLSIDKSGSWLRWCLSCKRIMKIRICWQVMLRTCR